jgi:branched-chain amino acid transport system ATP-binding protein
LPSIVAEGVTVVIVEQDIVRALAAAQKVFCLREGRIVLAGNAGEITQEAIKHAYFGV